MFNNLFNNCIFALYSTNSQNSRINQQWCWPGDNVKSILHCSYNGQFTSVTDNRWISVRFRLNNWHSFSSEFRFEVKPGFWPGSATEVAAPRESKRWISVCDCVRCKEARIDLQYVSSNTTITTTHTHTGTKQQENTHSKIIKQAKVCYMIHISAFHVCYRTAVTERGDRWDNGDTEARI